MNNLDNVDELLAVDSMGMFEAAAKLPEQCEAAMAAGRSANLPSAEGVSHIVIFGLGGSGIGGDVLRAVCSEGFMLPITVVKGYTSPGFINDRSLVFAISYSGETEETIVAVEEAIARSARVVAVTSGGRLGELVDAAGGAVIGVEEGLQPRSAVGSLAFPAFAVLEEMGLLPGFEMEASAAIEQLAARRSQLTPDVPLDENPAKRLARSLARKFPIVYGGDLLGEVAAYRLKCQLNENAKVPAFWNYLPELDHNEIAGWGQHGDVTRQLVQLVFLRHDFEHPQIRRRFELTAELIDECIAGVEEVRATGDHPLAQLFDLFYVGDYASLYLAAGEGVDPGPIPAIDQLKSLLGVEGRNVA